MTIEELLKNAGIEDQTVIDAVKSEMPKNFLPLDEFNKRIAAAKKETETVQAAFDAFKAEADEKAKAGEGKESETAQKLADLQAKFDKLQGDYTDSQNKHKQRKATDALTDALKKAGASDSALKLLAASGLSSIEYGDDGEPSNVETVLEKLKGENEGLFGVEVDTGKPSAKGDGKNGATDDFLAGFGSTDRK